MNQNEIFEQIADLEREIALLPEGGIARKRIKNKDYYYHRVYKDGKRIETYISFDELYDLRNQIEKRKELEKRLRAYISMYDNRNDLGRKDIVSKTDTYSYKTIVRYGEKLKAQTVSASKLLRRECIGKLHEYVNSDSNDKVFILYGLRRTGKTTMIRQVLSELSEAEFDKAAFIQVTRKDTLADIDDDMKLLEKNGFKYIFIDEITLMEDFVTGAALFSDIYASSGMKIVLSGTDSLGFAFTKDEQLYDRCVMLHTTFIPYREFENVLGISGIDQYIRYGGTMSLSGVDYNENTPFYDATSTSAYIDAAIAKNIQHSLMLYQYGGHFRSLIDLYEKGELTNVINRVVEDMNHRFTTKVVERTFKSQDIAITATNLLKDREKPINILKAMDVDSITAGIKQMLDILNKEEQEVNIKDIHMSQIKEYLKLLDLVMDIDLEFLPYSGEKGSITVISQPGLRYAQAEAIATNIINDSLFQNLSIIDRKRILERLLSEIRGRMMEDIVLLETKLACKDKKVFKLQFAVGEYDMVVYDPKSLSCSIYEVKYSKKRVDEQFKHLVDEDKLSATRFRYGEINGRYVIYRGETIQEGVIQYINVEEYLKSL